MNILLPDKKITIELSLRELTIVYNVLLKREYSLVDAIVVLPIFQQIEFILEQHKTKEGESMSDEEIKTESKEETKNETVENSAPEGAEVENATSE